MRAMKIALISVCFLLISQSAFALFCPQCGNKNPDDAKYCMGCGTSIKSEGNKTEGLHEPKPVTLGGYKEILMGLQNKNGSFVTDITGYLYQDKQSPTTYHLIIQNNSIFNAL